MCLRDQIFRVLLEHFISEVVTAGSNLCKSCCGRSCSISFNVFYHRFCAQTTARAMIISPVTASENGMCGVLFSYNFINFAQVTVGVGVFLRSFYQL